MLFQKRIDMAFDRLREDRERRDAAAAGKNDLYIERGDFGAMWIAGMQMIVLPALLVLVLICGLTALLFL